MNPHIEQAVTEYINDYSDFLEQFDPYYELSRERRILSLEAYVRSRILNDVEASMRSALADQRSK